MKKQLYYVYYLYFEDGKLADVGRSRDPGWRQRAKERKHGLKFSIEISRGMSFKVACEFEIAELLRLRPPLCKRVISSPGMYGKKRPHSTAHIQALIDTHVGMLGKHHSEAARAKMLGRGTSTKQKAAVRKAATGRVKSAEELLKLSNSLCLAWDRRHLLASGYGHPWRLATLDAKTRAMVEAL